MIWFLTVKPWFRWALCHDNLKTLPGRIPSKWLYISVLPIRVIMISHEGDVSCCFSPEVVCSALWAEPLNQKQWFQLLSHTLKYGTQEVSWLNNCNCNNINDTSGNQGKHTWTEANILVYLMYSTSMYSMSLWAYTVQLCLGRYFVCKLVTVLMKKYQLPWLYY